LDLGAILLGGCGQGRLAFLTHGSHLCRVLALDARDVPAMGIGLPLEILLVLLPLRRQIALPALVGRRQIRLALLPGARQIGQPALIGLLELFLLVLARRGQRPLFLAVAIGQRRFLCFVQRGHLTGVLIPERRHALLVIGAQALVGFLMIRLELGLFLLGLILGPRQLARPVGTHALVFFLRRRLFLGRLALAVLDLVP